MQENVATAIAELIDEAPDEWTLERLEIIKDFFFNSSD
tara:strand:- start:680 stop:793 length:114 start_codon:yes stop_codon:yes gene_type:complete